MPAIRPHSLDPQTIQQLRELVSATYTGRDDLYQAAAGLQDRELSAICRKLADELAGTSAHLSQIIAMHGQEPVGPGSVQSALGDEILRFLREHEHDKGILSVAKKAQAGMREQYDATIAVTQDAEAQALLKQQREEVDFGEKVLRRIARETGDEPGPPAEEGQ
jgi:uncharacterized protein (TIGR02284 family)